MTRFDDEAATWDEDPAKRERAAAVAVAIRQQLDLTGRPTLLEYGAGTGLLAQQLADTVGAMTLTDPSTGMREVMHAKVARGELPADTTVVDLDLAVQDPPGDRFGLVAASMVLHHIPDLDPVLRGLGASVADDGWLCVADLDAEDGSFHDDSFDGHHGFDRDELAGKLRDVGFMQVRFTTCVEVQRHGRAYPVFLALASRR
jgi:predicted TPR repeat methyltransferase